MNACIFCSSTEENVDYIKNFDFKNSFIICADGGAKLAESVGIKPDLQIGDGDSFFKKSTAKKTKELLPEKDLTDGQAAAEEALKKGIKEIYFFGATGGRLDHEYANYCLLRFLLEKGAFGTIINKNNRIFMLDGSAKVFSKGEKYISFFPFGGDVKDFSVKNVKYELCGHCLKNNCSLTVSNEFLSADIPAEISFLKGYVIVFCSND